MGDARAGDTRSGDTGAAARGAPDSTEPPRGGSGSADTGATGTEPGRDSTGRRPAAGKQTVSFAPPARAGRRRRSAVTGVFVTLVGMTALLSG